MTIAEDQIAEVAEWLRVSSLNRTSPLGELIIPGPYGTIVPVGINAVGHPDYSALWAAGGVPMLTPQASAAPVNLSPPPSQTGNSMDRALHVLWRIIQGNFPKIAVVGLPTQATSIQAALTAAGLGSIDLAARGVLALPLWPLTALQQEEMAPRLPVA